MATAPAPSSRSERLKIGSRKFKVSWPAFDGNRGYAAASIPPGHYSREIHGRRPGPAAPGRHRNRTRMTATTPIDPQAATASRVFTATELDRQPAGRVIFSATAWRSSTGRREGPSRSTPTTRPAGQRLPASAPLPWSTTRRIRRRRRLLELRPGYRRSMARTGSRLPRWRFGTARAQGRRRPYYDRRHAVMARTSCADSPESWKQWLGYY